MDRYITKSFFETQKIGQNFASKILALGPQKKAVVLELQGDLGAGKTTFLQGFAKGLGIKEKINSPTFVIMKKFSIPKSTIPQFQRSLKLRYSCFYHFDCYRLNNPEEILHLGFKEIISNPENIVAIEWPKRLGRILPKNKILIKFEHLEKNKREINIIDNF